MDHSIYAHNKSLMESNLHQGFDNLENSQNLHEDGAQFYRSSGPPFPTATAELVRPMLSSPQMNRLPTPIQGSNQFHNGPLNGFQQDTEIKSNMHSSYGLSQGLPKNAQPTLSNQGCMGPIVSQADPTVSNAGFSRPYLPPSSLRSIQNASGATHAMPQRLAHPTPLYSSTPSGAPNYYPPTHFESQQNIGPNYGDMLNASPHSTHLPAGQNNLIDPFLSASSTAMQQSTQAPPLLNVAQSNLGATHRHLSPPSSQLSWPQKSQQQQWQHPPTQQQAPLQQQLNQQSHPQLSGQPIHAPSNQQGQPIYAPSNQQGQPIHAPLNQQGQPIYAPSNQQGQPIHAPSNQQGQPIYAPQNQQGQSQQLPWQLLQDPSRGQANWQQPPNPQGHPQLSSWQHPRQQFVQSQQPFQNHHDARQGLQGSFDGLDLNRDNKAMKFHNLLQEKVSVPREGFVMNEPVLNPSFRTINCNPDIMCCTLNTIPNSSSLLKKTRLPFGILLHPFKDLSLPLVQPNVIVRCRSCRTYINPFVTFLDPGRWRCNICERINDVPTDFTYDAATRSYGEPNKRPEVKNTTMELMATDDYLIRPPMPAVYLYLLDVSHNAIETGYLEIFCKTLLSQLDKIPGDARKQIGFVGYDSSLYFFNLSEELSQPQMIVMPDLEEPFIPFPDNLLVNLQQSKKLVIDLLQKLPSMFRDSREVGSALGSALEFAVKMMVPSGGRISVFQTILPTVGAGSLKSREDSNERVDKKIGCLGPATDFYKNIALECSTNHVAVDLFLFNSQYCDIATIGGVSKFTGGCMHYFPNFHASTNSTETKRFRSSLLRYFTRKIGFEAVLRIRCSKGLSIQNYHGNFFVRSTDLLSLPNLNPDAGYAVQVGIDEDLTSKYVSFQTAILYTSSKAERRIRVHTICIPVSSIQSEIIASANQIACIGFLSKMAVDKSLTQGLSDSREAMVSVVVDMLTASCDLLAPGQKSSNQIMAPESLKFIPLLIHALLKSSAFRVGVATKVDDRIVAMEMCKNLSLKLLLLHIHPYLYPVHNLDEKTLSSASEGEKLICPPIVPLSSTQVDRHGAYIMEAGSYIYFYLGPAISDLFCLDVFGVNSVGQVHEGELILPELESNISKYLRKFFSHLNKDLSVYAPLILIKNDGKMKHLFSQHLIEDRTESSFSFQEFLQHVQKEMKT